MTLIISSIIMVVVFGSIMIAEFRHGKKTATRQQYDDVLEGVSRRVNARYVAKFGKDPTGAVPIFNDKNRS